MTRLTLVVGQRRSALVAASLLIVACDADFTAVGSGDAAAPASESADSGPISSLDAASPVVSGPDSAIASDSGPSGADAAADGGKQYPRDAGARDAAPGGAPDAVSLPGGGPPAPWAGKDIGVVAQPGGTTATPAAFTVVAGGSDIGGTADSFHFVHQALVGDGEIVARVGAFVGAEPASKAGVMFRSGLEAGAAAVFLAVLGDSSSGGRLQTRATGGSTTAVTMADPGLKTGQFLRLVRAGRTFTAYRSANRATWTRVGSVEVDMPATAYVGLATEAHSTTSTVQVAYNYATIDNLAGDPAAAAWQHLEVGTLGGSASFGAGQLTLTGFGEPFTEAQDFFSGVAQVVSGSHRLTARVTAQTSNDPEARAGLMFREGLISTTSRMAPHAFISVSPHKGVQFFSRSEQGGLTAGGARKMEAKTPLWLRLEKVELGTQDRFTGWYSLDGTAWTMLDSVSFSAAQPLLMAIVSGSGNARVAGTARLDGISSGPVAGDGGVMGSADASTPDSPGNIDVVRDAGPSD